LFFFVTTSQLLFAKDFATQLKAMQEAGKRSEEIQAFIEKSADSNRDNPAYYIATANYWWQAAQSLSITDKPAEDNDLVVADSKTGKAVGSISTTGVNNPEIPQKAIDLLVEAHKRFPRRLDIAWGLVDLQFAQKQYKPCLQTCLGIIRIAQSVKNKPFLTANDKPIKEPLDKLIPERLQRTNAAFYRAETKEADECLVILSKAIISAYPKHPYAYNILGAFYGANNDIPKCIEYLAKAHEIVPDDVLIALNLADFLLKNDKKEEARKLYKKVLDGKADDEFKAEAEKALKSLEEK